MAEEIRLKSGTVEITAELNSTRTAQSIWRALPVTTRVNLWQDEIYFALPIPTVSETAQPFINVGDLGYYEGILHIFFNAPPGSLGQVVRPAQPAVVVGHVAGDLSALMQIISGTEITLTRRGLAKAEAEAVVKRTVYYFGEPGAANTDLVVEAVAGRLDAGDVRRLVIGSTSGESALKFARVLGGRADLVCVSQSPYRREWGETWPVMKGETKKELENLGVIVLDNAPYIFHSSLLEAARWSDAFPERLVKETLYAFGQGLKVAVEAALMAVAGGVVPPYEDVIAVGGSGNGLDSAILLRATYPATVFAQDPAKRLEIREIIALPTAKKWWD